MINLILLGFIYVNATYGVNSTLIDSAVSVTTEYYQPEVATSVFWSDDDLDAVTKFLIKYPGSIEIAFLYEDDDNNTIILETMQHDRYTQIVFFASDPDEFEKFMILINRKLRFPIRLVLVLNKPVSEIPELSTFIDIAWMNNLADIIIISQNYMEEVILSTYYPYKDGICGNNVPITINRSENMFPEKFFNFNKCPIRVSASLYPPFVDLKIENNTITKLSGYDADVIRFIADSLNATLDIVELPSFGSCVNGTVSGGFIDLLSNETDMLLPAGIFTQGRYLVTQTTHVYYDTDIRWIGPKRREIYRWIKVLMPFLNSVTPFLCLAFTLFAIVAKIIRRCKRWERGKGSSICFQTFTLLLGQTVKYITYKITMLSSFFLLWIWFCLIVRIDYQGHLVEARRYQFLEPPLSSLVEAVANVDAFGGLDVFLDYYRDTPLEHSYTIIQRSDLHTYFERIVDGERFLLASDAFLFRQIRHSIQVLEEPISHTSSCLYMRPGWPAASTVDNLIVILLEAGLIEKIINVGINSRGKEIGNDEGTEAQPLNMSTLNACFYGISVMWLICSVVFVIEIIWHRYGHLVWSGPLTRINSHYRAKGVSKWWMISLRRSVGSEPVCWSDDTNVGAPAKFWTKRSQNSTKQCRQDEISFYQ